MLGDSAIAVHPEDDRYKVWSSHHRVAGEHPDARSVCEHTRRDGGHDASSKKHVCWLGVKPSAWLKSRASLGRTHVIVVVKDEHPEQDTSRHGNGKETCKDGFEYLKSYSWDEGVEAILMPKESPSKSWWNITAINRVNAKPSCKRRTADRMTY